MDEIGMGPSDEDLARNLRVAVERLNIEFGAVNEARRKAEKAGMVVRVGLEDFGRLQLLLEIKRTQTLAKIGEFRY